MRENRITNEVLIEMLLFAKEWLQLNQVQIEKLRQDLRDCQNRKKPAPPGTHYRVGVQFDDKEEE